MRKSFVVSNSVNEIKLNFDLEGFQGNSIFSKSGSLKIESCGIIHRINLFFKGVEWRSNKLWRARRGEPSETPWRNQSSASKEKWYKSKEIEKIDG